MYQSGNFAFEGRKVTGVYKMRAESVAPKEQAKRTGWHRCLGHLNYDTLNAMAGRKVVRGLPSLLSMSSHHCEYCVLETNTRLPFKASKNTPTLGSYKLLHMDLCGPFKSSLGGSKYRVVIVSNRSRRVTAHFMKSKDINHTDRD